MGDFKNPAEHDRRKLSEHKDGTIQVLGSYATCQRMLALHGSCTRSTGAMQKALQLY